MILPSVPAWTDLHPAVVHFPVALLPVAWLLVLLGAFGGRIATGMRVAAAVVLAIGAVAAVLAVETGEAAAERHRTLPPGAAALLEQHQELGEATRTVTVGLAVLYLAGLAGGRLLRGGPSRAVVAGAHLAYLAVHLVAVLVLLETASLGGELVHRWGVSGSTPVERPATGETGVADVHSGDAAAVSAGAR